MGGDAVYQAFRPAPADGATNVLPGTALRWRSGHEAERQDLLIGTDRDTLAAVAGAQTSTSHTPVGLRCGKTYYWRVDEARDGRKHTGRVWSFTTASGKADFPTPKDGAESVSRHPVLTWRPGCPGARHALFFGTTPDSMVRVAQSRDKAMFAPRDLELGKTYFWRVDEAYDDQIVQGDPWSFTVERGAAKNPQPADRDGYVPARTTLRWKPGDPAFRHNVYFGTDPKALRLAALKLVEPAFAPDGMTLGHTYYWRVDEVLPDATVKGDLWSFTTGDWLTDDGTRLGPRKTDAILGIPGAWTGGYEKRASRDTAARIHADVCVVGGGSGGIGAAIAAARAGASVVLVEREDKLGGTSSQAYVNSWEPGPGCSIALEIFDRLSQVPGAVHKMDYEKTLTRAQHRSVQFEIEPFCRVVDDMLAATGRCRVLLQTSFIEAETHVDGRRVWSVKAVSKDGTVRRIRAAVFIDCTGGAYLCQAAGCAVMLGEDAKSRFNEPSAGDKPRRIVNALILGYRIRRSDNPKIQPAVPDLTCRGGYAFRVPSGDMLVNPCGGMMRGIELIDRGYAETMEECKRRVKAHWHWLQKTEYPQYEFVSYAPMLGIRESYRVVGEYVLREQDLVAGVKKQPHPDVIAIADHPLDTHGAGGVRRKVATPYGIPYRCLVPKGGWTNLLIACRGASFSHIAASSCRLSRTMMQLGHAAGLAAAQAVRTGCAVGDVDVVAIQKQLLL
jgi:NAD(P)-dependent dehydrogenase (short-subunit alcohol dehydrogenase family)